MSKVDTSVIGKGLNSNDQSVDNQTLVQVNAIIRDHDVEEIGIYLREAMGAMKPITA
jgi:ketol-acid reductoisomerase